MIGCSMQKSGSNKVSTALYSNVAKKILSDSIAAKPGDCITVETWNPGLDFAREFVTEARKLGCNPILVFEDESAYVKGVKSSPAEFQGNMGKHEMALLSNSDAYVFIPGPPIATYSTSLSAQEKSRSTAYNSSWYEAAEKARLKGVRLSFGYIGADYSKLLGKSVASIVSHQLNASLVDFREIERIGKGVIGSLGDDKTAKLSTKKGAELTFKLKGSYSLEDGIVNSDDIAKGENMAYLPPGFVSKEIDPASANGRVHLASSISRLGLIKDSSLEFKEGKLVGFESSSLSSRKMLKEIFESTPESSRSLTLVTVGLNPKMKYGFGQDRFVRGAIGLAGFGFSIIAESPSLSADETILVEKGIFQPAQALKITT